MSDPLVRVSIIICTCNRADGLRETLESIGRVEVPEDLATELLVVDNASTDHTGEVVDQVDFVNMPVRYIHEPRRGKCYAYNTGMAAARGEIFLFTDDDVRVPTNWIEGMCRPIKDRSADAVAGGVRIAPHLERPWLVGCLRVMVACSDHRQPGDAPSSMIGANMAFARKVLGRVPAFDAELGPGALGFGDEALFSMQLRVAGFRILGSWQLSVEHHFEESRLAKPAFVELAYRMGRTRAYLQHHWEHNRVLCARLQLAWMLCKLHARRLIGRNARRPEVLVPWEMSYLSRIACLKQYLLERKRPHNYDRHGLVKRCGILYEKSVDNGLQRGRAAPSVPAGIQPEGRLC